MSREDRPKAQALFERSRPVFGEKTTFAEAFPVVESVEIRVKESGAGAFSFGGNGWSVRQPAEFVNCSNPRCYGGGFSIGSVLRKMVAGRETAKEGDALCRGNEASPKGKRVYRRCINFFEYEVHLKYKDIADAGWVVEP